MKPHGLSRLRRWWLPLFVMALILATVFGWIVAYTHCPVNPNLIRTLVGHDSPVGSVAFHPNGWRLATTSVGWPRGHTEVRLWDATTGQSTVILSGVPGRFSSIAFDAEGKHLAACTLDGTVVVATADTGQPILTLPRVFSSAHSVAFSHDGERVAAGGDQRNKNAASNVDGALKVWNLVTGKEIFACTGHTDRIVSVVFSPDGTRLVSGSWDKTVRVWDAQTGAEVFTLRGHTGYISCVTVSRDGRRFASCSDARDSAHGSLWKGEIRIWDLQTGQELLNLHGHGGAISGVAFSPDGLRLASAGLHDSTVKLWHPDTGQELLSFQAHCSGISALAFGPEGHRVATASYDGTVSISSASTGK